MENTGVYESLEKNMMRVSRKYRESVRVYECV